MSFGCFESVPSLRLNYSAARVAVRFGTSHSADGSGEVLSTSFQPKGFACGAKITIF